MRVLLVEDEPMLADAIGAGLRSEAIAVDVVLDGGAAIDRMRVYDYDVIALDRDIPIVHGDDRGGCRRLVDLRAAPGAGAPDPPHGASGLLSERINLAGNKFDGSSYAVSYERQLVSRKLDSPGDDDAQV